MAKMSTLYATILTFLNWFSITGILALSFMKDGKNNLTNVIIVAFFTYLIALLLLSSFCLTENECCAACFPAEKCCFCDRDKKDNKKGSTTGDNKKGKESENCCTGFCDCLFDCLFIPIGGCTRKLGKQGTRYIAVIILSIAHLGMAILCFYSVKGTNESMSGNTVGIVIISIVVTIANLFGIFAPCFECCEKLRYKETPKEKKSEKINNDNNRIEENKNDVIVYNDSIKEPFIENDYSQGNKNDLIENSNNFDNVNNSNADYNNNDIGNNYNSVFGVRKEESNNIDSGNNFNNVFGVNKEENKNNDSGNNFNNVFGVNKEDNNNNSGNNYNKIFGIKKEDSN